MNLTTILKDVLQNPLPGKAAHLKMAPLPRRQSLISEVSLPCGARESAVMVIIIPAEELLESRLLFIKRSRYEGVHSGQIAFPGGKVDKSDIDYIATAVRELEEEVGITLEEIEIVGKLTPIYIPPSNFNIHPIVAIAKRSLCPIGDQREVSECRAIKLSQFICADNIKICDVIIKENEIVEAPCYLIDDFVIWGGTAMITCELTSILLKLE